MNAASGSITTVVVSAGTYHLPFSRLVEWVEPWSRRHPEVRMIVQHGPGITLPGAENHRILAHSELLRLIALADVVVLQGGAGGVMDARSLGRIPIVVPRIPIDNEVVDNHQLIFTEKAAALGLVHRATTPQQLEELLDAALAGELRTRAAEGGQTEGIISIAELLDELPPPLPAGERLLRLLRLRRGSPGQLRPEALEVEPASQGPEHPDVERSQHR